jgi:hypothetical protein
MLRVRYINNMKYIITESQYKLLTEEENILEVAGAEYFGGWEGLQQYLEKKGNPLYKIKGDLNLEQSDIIDLGNLVSVEGNLNLFGSYIESLGKLKHVGGNLDLYNTYIESLGELISVGGYLDISRTSITTLGDLKYVGDYLNLENTPLSKTTTWKDVKNQVEIKGALTM